MSDQPLLLCRKLSGGYANRRVLHDLDLTVRDGECVVVIGPNGHGKTTLLRAISGLLPDIGGDVSLAGINLRAKSPDAIVAAGVVHIPQGDLLFPDMTVIENLLMGAYLTRDRQEINRRLEEVFTLLPKLKERQKQLASTLSGGERRMVGIGRGLMSGGRLLLIDEPSLGLAPIVIEQIYKLLDQLRRSGRSIMLVEETANRALPLADEIYLLDGGRFAWHGNPTELASRTELINTYLGA
ncbi:ABC transporter ATP-binding protein [Dongia soli]|uniref:ABC transporter ATP-binding protein n=1 Tax=Dongia soli TaxID=600628 RepID=A0ABU5EI60_9PROT|nr:ABC transporter ATP-binding protein [Dongia soli]MDY0885534.1 ABC transporter ATP-binding protein [Dongia soli]